MNSKSILLKDMDKKDKGTFSLWLRDVDVVRFLIDMFKESRSSNNVLKIPFGKNRKLFILQTNDGNKIGFCGLYDIDWQQKKCSMYIYIDNNKKLNDENIHEIINSIVKGTVLSKNFKIIEIHTKEDKFVSYFNNIIDIRKDDNEFIFKLELMAK